MAPEPSKTLILFDLDGVIIDSRPNMEKAWQEVLRQTGADIPFERYFAEIGRSFPDIMDRIGLGDWTDVAQKAFRIASMEHLDLVHFYDGVAETLSRLQGSGIRLGVVTSKDTLRTDAILAMLAVDFATVQTPNSRYRGKPAPDHLLAAMADACADPAETIYVGDMHLDYEAAQRAGIDYLHARWGYGERPAETVDAIDSFTDILSYLGIETS